MKPPESITIYTITVLDERIVTLPAAQRTPGIFTNIDDAIYMVKNNELDISENGTNQYAVIEQTFLNRILPASGHKMWFEWDDIEKEYYEINAPSKYARIVGFGIG